MKRIGLITPEFGREKGGIQNWMYYVQRLLEERGYPVERYVVREENPLTKLPKLHKASLYLLATWKMSLFLLPLPSARKKPVFVFVHGNEILNLNALQKKWLDLLISCPNVRFIANSRAVAELFHERFGRKVDAVQHPFMEIPTEPPRKRSGTPLFFTVTRLVGRKNLHCVLQALKRVKEEGFVFRYVIAGQGEERERLERLAVSLGLEKEVVFEGPVSEEKKRELFRRSDYFLLPSVFDEKRGSVEGYGIVFIEANAFGVPVLSGNTGGMVEAVIDGETGLHCDGSVEEIATGIKKLLHTEFDREKILRHARKHDYRKQRAFLSWIENGTVNHA